MARWARDAGHILRFIEYMDVGTTNGWRLDEVVPAEEIVDADRRPRCRSSRPTPQYRGRGRGALAVRRRRAARSGSSRR